MGTMFLFILCLALVVVIIAGVWKAFEKAGHPGWSAIIPIYNIYIMCKIAGKSGWWVLLMCIPYVGLIFSIIVSIEIAKAFGKSSGFGVGLALLSPIFWPMLGFGDAQFIGTHGETELQKDINVIGSN